MSNLKTALVTGGARRIGAALTEALHANGYNVIIHYRRSKKAAEALCKKCCKKRPHSASILFADLEKSGDISALIQRAYKIWQRLDVIINNASQYFPTKIGNTTEQQWLSITKSNLMAPFFIAQAAFPFLQRTEGCIINLSDINVSHPQSTYSVYTSAKAGLNTLTRALALEFSPLVRVNALALGTTLWPEGKNKLPPETQKKIIHGFPLQRLATLDEITQTMLFLINNKFVTGQIIFVDGGKSL